MKAGDALLSLDSPELAQAVADLQKAQSDETRKKLALARATSLVQAGVAPRKIVGTPRATSTPHAPSPCGHSGGCATSRRVVARAAALCCVRPSPA